MNVDTPFSMISSKISRGHSENLRLVSGIQDYDTMLKISGSIDLLQKVEEQNCKQCKSTRVISFRD